MATPTDTCILLLGKTGSGKSATGNSILRRREFKSKTSFTSVTNGSDYGVSEFNSRKIKVIDIPGVGDNRLDKAWAVQLVLKTIESVIAATPEGFNAMLFVLKYGTRYTDEDKLVIAFLKDVLGKDFIRNYCILVVTSGDHFEMDNEDTGLSFPQWCQEETGLFKDLLNECNNRIVLFNNFTKDERTKIEQLTKLLEMVDQLSSGRQRYTKETFLEAEKTRDRITIESQLPIIGKEILEETNFVMEKLAAVQEKENPEKKIIELKELQGRLNGCLQSIIFRDKETGALDELCSSVRSTQRMLEEEIKSCEKQKAEKEKEIEKKDTQSQLQMFEERRRIDAQMMMLMLNAYRTDRDDDVFRRQLMVSITNSNPPGLGCIVS